MSKYHAKKVSMYGISFDSGKEAMRYAELLTMQRSGKITGLKRQVRFNLIPKQDGERACDYIADFVYDKDGKTVVEDVKGMRTREYIIKRKLMLFRHGIHIHEV